MHNKEDENHAIIARLADFQKRHEEMTAQLESAMAESAAYKAQETEVRCNHFLSPWGPRDSRCLLFPFFFGFIVSSSS